jgi:signal transduction histidine kinase
MHTSPLLAQFEKTYNLLNDRLRTSEQELFSLVSQEAEKGRYRALGEFSALVAHDLSGPLHAANFCASELMGAPQPEKVKPYLERISKNLSRALELTGSIRARLKNPSHEGGAGTFGEAHKHVVNLLSVQYHTENFQKVQFQVDPQVDRLHLRISSVDLTHVLDNLYRNAVENLLRNAISAPSIKVTLANLSLEEAEITVEDNGSGLSQQDFERITSYQFKREPSSLSNQGLGLRLTRRLIEFNQGHLEVRPQASDVGTFFSLRLPLAVAIQTETKHTFEETPSLKTTPA